MTIQATEEMDPAQVRANCEAQHKYLTWRAQKVINILHVRTETASVFVSLSQWILFVDGRILDMVFLRN